MTTFQLTMTVSTGHNITEDEMMVLFEKWVDLVPHSVDMESGLFNGTAVLTGLSVERLADGGDGVKQGGE